MQIPPDLLHKEYDDRYFDVVNALDEAKHVFFEGSGLLRRLQAAAQQKSEFRIGETGFGAGRILLALMHYIEEHQLSGLSITYHSVELHPVSAGKMALLLEGFRPAAGSLIDLLVGAYGGIEIAQPGRHCIEFNRPFGRIGLQLWIGEALEMVQDLDRPCDAWFLDGHGPKKNPSIWRHELLMAVGRKAVDGGSCATYTVSGAVRRSLAEAGFAVSQRPGFGGKKAVLSGIKR